MRSQISYIHLNSWAKEALVRNSVPTSVSCRVLPLLSSKSFSISGLKMSSLIFLDLILVQDIKQDSHLYLLHVDIQYSQHQFSCCLSLLCPFCHILNDYSYSYSCFTFRFISLVSMSILCKYHTVFIITAL